MGPKQISRTPACCCCCPRAAAAEAAAPAKAEAHSHKPDPAASLVGLNWRATAGSHVVGGCCPWAGAAGTWHRRRLRWRGGGAAVHTGVSMCVWEVGEERAPHGTGRAWRRVLCTVAGGRVDCGVAVLQAAVLQLVRPPPTATCPRPHLRLMLHMHAPARAGGRRRVRTLIVIGSRAAWTILDCRRRQCSHGAATMRGFTATSCLVQAGKAIASLRHLPWPWRRRPRRRCRHRLCRRHPRPASLPGAVAGLGGWPPCAAR